MKEKLETYSSFQDRVAIQFQWLQRKVHRKNQCQGWEQSRVTLLVQEKARTRLPHGTIGVLEMRESAWQNEIATGC